MTKILGVGGQGTAYLANMKDAEPVVLKEYILPVFVDAKVRREAIETFNHETDVLKRVHSPLIVSLEEAFIEDNRAYLVLEYVDGPSLKEVVSAAVAIAIEIAGVASTEQRHEQQQKQQ